MKTVIKTVSSGKAMLTMSVLLTALNANLIAAQTPADSVQTKTNKIITEKFPNTRFFDLQYTNFSESNYSSKLHGKPFGEGTVTSHSRVETTLNIPILIKQQWMLSSTLNYKMESFYIQNGKNISEEYPQFSVAKNEIYHYYSGVLNLGHYTQLFGKMAIYNASLLSDWSGEGFERATGAISGVVVMKKTPETTITIGLIGCIDKAAQFPLIPTFSYEHKFRNSPWTIDILLPKYVYFRKPLSENSRLSVGTALDTQNFYTYTNNTEIKGTYNYSRNEFKTSLVYERYLGNGLAATVNAGVVNIFNSRVTKKGEPQNHNAANVTQDICGYANIGISYNP